MMRGQEETSTRQVRHKKGSSLRSFMFMEELRSFYRVPDGISLELLDESTSSTVGQADNAVFFTRKQFTAGIRFPVSSLVK